MRFNHCHIWSGGLWGAVCARVGTCCLTAPVLRWSVQEALKVMEFSEEEIRDVFKLLSAVLQMGNIEFMTAGGAQITSKGGRRGNLCVWEVGKGGCRTKGDKMRPQTVETLQDAGI